MRRELCSAVQRPPLKTPLFSNQNVNRIPKLIFSRRLFTPRMTNTVRLVVILATVSIFRDAFVHYT